MFKLTEKAKEKIKEMINKEGQDYYLRVYAIPSGCCGIDFGMELTNETDSSDNFIDFQDFKVVIDDFSYPFIENLQIDVIEKEQKLYFILDKQNKDENECECGSGCGCGSGCECGSRCGCGSGCECCH